MVSPLPEQGKGERLQDEIDSATIEKRLAFIRENYRVIREKLLEIVNGTAENEMPRPKPHDQVAAAEAVVTMGLGALSAEMAAGPV
jgi:hypothetical protein